MFGAAVALPAVFGTVILFPGGKGVIIVFRYHFTCWLLSHPGLLKVLFAVLRRFRPIAIFGKTVIVTKAADVREVLQRFDDFYLNEAVAPGMPWGPFLFNVDWHTQHDTERGALERARCPADDLAIIRQKTIEVCEQQIALAQNNPAGRREIDIVTQLCEPVMVNVLAAHLGIKPVNRNEFETAEILRSIASAIMVVPPEGTPKWQEWRANTDKLTQHLKGLIGDAATKPTVAIPCHEARARTGDFLTRLVAMVGSQPWLDQDWVRRYLTGLAAAGDATIVRASAHVLDQLFRHPDGFKRAIALVRRIDEAEARLQQLRIDDASKSKLEAIAIELAELRRRLQLIIYEALRFRPMLPLLVRTIPRDTIIAKDTARARLAPAGGTLLVGLLGAMFDPEVFEHPSKFCSSRPLDDYVHFGFGPRKCFGKYLADTVILEVMCALLRLPDLKRAGGANGRILYDGPAAAQLRVTFANEAGGAQTEGRPVS